MNSLHLLLAMPGGSEWVLLLIAFPVYFLPSIIAGYRRKSNVSAIIMLNLFLGWTVLGWIISCVWALSPDNNQASTVIINNTGQSYSQEYKTENSDSKPQVHHETTSTTVITQQGKLDQLRQLKQLMDEGILTTEEFNKQKALILG